MSEKTSIIVIAYNEEKYIAGILESLLAQTCKDFELIIVDSNSTDGTEQIAMSFAANFDEFRYIKLKSARGPAFGRNQGAEFAKYERLIFFDADTRVEEDFIQRTSDQFVRRRLDLAACPMKISDGNFASAIGAFILNSFMILLKPIYSSAYGACLISTKRVHSSIGGFDESLGICEDCNYVKKARRHHHFRFGIMTRYFSTSERRVETEGSMRLMLKYIKVHIYRMLTGKEVRRRDIKYLYGNF